MRKIAAFLIGCALVAVGCGGDEPQASAEPEKPTATPTPTATPEGRFPVAYKVPIDVVRRLSTGDARALIREEGELIASSDYDDITNVVLADWLEKKRGITVEDPGVLTPTYRKVYEEQDTYLMIFSRDPKVAEALDRLRPNKRRLAAFYNNWGGEYDPFPKAGEAMLDRLRIFRLALRAGDERHVVIIPEIS